MALATPARRLAARRAGLLDDLVAQLASRDPAVLTECLASLRQLLADEDCSVVFANRGGDQALLRLLRHRASGGGEEGWEGVDEEVEAVVSLRMACKVPGRGFPALAAPDSTDPPFPAVHTFTLPGRCAALHVLCRSVPTRMSSHDDVGNILWPAAVVQSQWIAANGDLFMGKRVLEIGAGIGLLGLVAAQFCASIAITDYASALVDNISYNIALHMPEGACDAKTGRGDAGVPACGSEAGDGSVSAADAGRAGTEGGDGIVSAPESEGGVGSVFVGAGCPPATGENVCVCAGPAINCPRRCVGVRLDWEDVVRGEYPLGAYDVIIGSDIVYRKEDVVLIAAVLKVAMRKSGVAYISSAPPRSRFGVQFIQPVLEEAGFVVTASPLAAAGGTSDVVDACGYGDEIQMFTVRFP